MSHALHLLMAGSLLLATGCQQPMAATTPLLIQSNSSSWQCPANQSCDGTPDYRALLVNVGKQEVYLSFGPELKAPYTPAQLAQHFRFGDIYHPTAKGMIAIHLENSERGEGRIEFVSAADGRLKAQVTAQRYRLQNQGKPGPDCRTDDIKGYCLEEKRIEAPLTLQLDLALP